MKTKNFNLLCQIAAPLVSVFVILGLMFSPGCSHMKVWESGHYYTGDSDTHRLMKEIDKTDLIVVYDTYYKKFDIGVGKMSGDARNPVMFSYDELDHYFEARTRKSFIAVMTRHDSALETAESEKVIRKLTDYFTKIGYERILLLGAMCNGIRVHKDIRNKKTKID